ncbi:hypothetical protein HYV44_02580 [Candidatus Microgenomates bacterium]|nr:hypothetical protein [Candidatus Microgenomates bacterium]
MENKNKIFLVAGILGVLLLLVIIIPSFTGKNKGGTEQIVTSIILAKSVSEAGVATGQTDIFSTEDPGIYALVSLNALPAKSNVEYQWYYASGRSVQYSEKKKPEKDYTGKSRAVFPKTEKSFISGDYEFRILISNQLVGKKSFVIKTPNELKKDYRLTVITDAQLVEKVSLSGVPGSIGKDVFAADTANIYAAISFSGASSNVFEAQWVYLPENKIFKTYKKTITGNGTFAVPLEAKKDSWLPVASWAKGKYSLKITLDDDLVRELFFEIQ